MADYDSDLEGVNEFPIRNVIVSPDKKPSSKDKQYTLFIWFMPDHDQYKTFEFITGQQNVRNFVRENVDVIDFTKSLISNWKELPESINGFIRLSEFMDYLDNLEYEDGTLVYDDGFALKDYLSSLTEIYTLNEEEKENYLNAIHTMQRGSQMVLIENLEGEDI